MKSEGEQIQEWLAARSAKGRPEYKVLTIFAEWIKRKPVPVVLASDPNVAGFVRRLMQSEQEGEAINEKLDQSIQKAGEVHERVTALKQDYKQGTGRDWEDS